MRYRVTGRSRGWVALVVGCVAVALVVGAAGSGSADTPESGSAAGDAFYNPPAQIPQQPGSVVETRPMTVLAAPPTAAGWPGTAQLTMYTTTLQDGSPTAATGTYIEPANPWKGPGPRPTVVIAPGTSGQGDQCAMSRAFSTGVTVTATPRLSLSANQEALSSAVWSELGARVFVVDYIGLGTPGMHTYVNRAESAHAVLDGARAANRLGGVGPGEPVLFWGYSQGGGASAAAAELQPQYAPDLDLKGTWAGGPTADLTAILQRIDGGLIGGAIGYAVNGMLARYPDLAPIVDRIASPSGRAMLDTLSTECIGDVVLKQPFLRTNSLTRDGRPLLDHLREYPEAMRALDEQRIGKRTPGSPVLITSGRNDDTVPYGQARQLASDWCAKGAKVTFRTNELPAILPGFTIPNHFGPEMIDGYGPNTAVGYLLDRLADKPVPTCTFT